VPLRTGCSSYLVRDRHTYWQIFFVGNLEVILKTIFIREINLLFL